jgi:CheY-like chemotaxis protein
MDTATLARASEPFFTTKPIGQGTGLGLAMARGFAQQSGGGFALRSKPGQGTVVSLWFPQAPDVSAVGGAEWTGSDHPCRTLTGAHILVVDDNAMVREVLAEQMEGLGHRVTQASDGLAALARLNEGIDVDLLVTDLSMPGMNGWVLIEEARRRRPGLPALLLTGYADADGWVGAEVEADDATIFLRKPVSGDELAQRAAALLAAATAQT